MVARRIAVRAEESQYDEIADRTQREWLLSEESNEQCGVTTRCPDTTTRVTPEEALLILEPYFLVMREAFVGAGLDAAKRAQLYVAPSMHDSPRHFAGTRDDGTVIMLAPEMVELPENTVAAIIAHEFGHATDFLYPGEFVLGPERVAMRRDRSDFDSDDHWVKWVAEWHKRDDDVVEFVADAIAEMVTGRRIGYVGPCKLQAFDRGKARPQGLR